MWWLIGSEPDFWVWGRGPGFESGISHNDPSRNILSFLTIKKSVYTNVKIYHPLFPVALSLTSSTIKKKFCAKKRRICFGPQYYSMRGGHRREKNWQTNRLPYPTLLPSSRILRLLLLLLSSSRSVAKMGLLVSGMKAATMMASMTSSAPNTNGGPGISAVTTYQTATKDNDASRRKVLCVTDCWRQLTSNASYSTTGPVELAYIVIGGLSP